MHCTFLSLKGVDRRLSLGVFVLLFGVWYCYKRGREERTKLEQSAQGSHQVLVEGAKQPSDDTADHGDGVRAVHKDSSASPFSP